MPTSTVGVEVLGRCSGDCHDEVDLVIEGLKPLVGTLIVRVEELSSSIASARGNSTVAASIWTLYGTLTVGIALFAVVAMANHSVARRRREVGIRTALGASPVRVTSMFVTESAIAVAAGVAGGAAATFYSTSAIQTLVAGLQLPSIVELSAAAAVVLFVAPIAAAISVRPITRQTAAALLRAPGVD
jgi:ABC-type antimicrobial peptide transport system permease subunit